MKYSQSVEETKERYARACAAAYRKSAGLLVCSQCGTSQNIKLHHPDYDEPWRVEPLCRYHHRSWHAILRRIKKRVRERMRLREEREMKTINGGAV